MRRRGNNGIKKEKIVMLAASAFALTALTMTGVYVNSRQNQSNQDGYNLDLSALDEDTSRQISEIQEQINDQVAQISGDDLDVEINYEATGAEDVVLPQEDISQLNGGNADHASALNERYGMNGGEYTEADSENELANMENMDDANGITSRIAEDENAQTTSAPKLEINNKLDFDQAEGLAWPVVGNVILNYSMDKAIYFETLNQYRYNPSIVIEAVVGEPITAAADGRVLSIKDNVETGGTIICDLGDGYELTYGQLENFTVSEGEFVTRGQIIGYVAEPSIFFSKEGSNVYFELTKDGDPVDPMTMLK